MGYISRPVRCSYGEHVQHIGTAFTRAKIANMMGLLSGELLAVGRMFYNPMVVPCHGVKCIFESGLAKGRGPSVTRELSLFDEFHVGISIEVV